MTTIIQNAAIVAGDPGRTVLHNASIAVDAISTVAHLHVCAAYANIPYAQEYNIGPTSIRDEWPVLKQPLQVQDGCLAVPDGPGLGVELDEDVVRKLAGVCLADEIPQRGGSGGVDEPTWRL